MVYGRICPQYRRGGRFFGRRVNCEQVPMLTLPPLNRRHQAGLFLVLVATGLSLFFEASTKQTAGIIVLGLAGTWFIGSVALRTLGVILSLMTFCIGFYIAVLPIWNERESVLIEAQEYDSAVAEIRGAIAKSPIWEIGDGPETLPADFFERQGKKKSSQKPWERYAELAKKRGGTKPSGTGDEVQFKSPTTGAVQVVPPEHWDEALKRGYTPTTHRVMYSPEGQQGMVPNEQVRAGPSPRPLSGYYG